MRKIFLLATFLIAYSTNASEIPSYLRAGDEKGEQGYMHGHSARIAKISAVESKIVRRPYDVLSYDLFMDWFGPLSKESLDSAGLPVVRAEDRIYSGVNKIRLRLDSANIFSISLNAGRMNIDSVISKNGQRLINSQPSNDEFQIITSPLNPKVGDTLELSVYYTYNGTDDDGFYLYPKGMFVGPGQTGDSVFVEERLAYTMSEPQDARYWMPCNDQPYDKAKATISVRVPAGFVVSSNGLLKAVSVNLGASTFIWSDTTQIATYLMVANASKFKEFSDTYHRVNKPGDSIPVLYYVWPSDFENTATDGSQYNAKHAFRNMIKMMEAYSSKLVEYPFVKYGMTSVQPFGFGGMEHQTMTTITRRWLRGFDDDGIAHELMHQWTGDLVTCATWSDLWLNEGGASWGEALWNEIAYGKQAYQNVMMGKRAGYMSRGFSARAIYGQPLPELFTYATTYAKSSWIYHMLRETLGDSTFFPWIKNYFSEFAYQSIETEDMIRSLEKFVPNPKVPFRKYFDQWVYAQGHPIYDVVVQNLDPENSSSHRVKIRINQTQTWENTPEVFAMPVEIELRGANGEIFVFEGINDKRSQDFDIETNFAVRSAIVDPDNKILCEKKSMVLASDGTGVVENLDNPIYEANIFPNPVANVHSASFQFAIAAPARVAIELYSTIGEKISTIHNADLNIGSYSLPINTGFLSSGTYIIRLTINGRSQSYTLQVKQ